MAVFSSFGTAGRTLARNPIILVVSAIFSALQFPVLLARSLDPVLAAVISLGFNGLFILALPFFQGGFVGLADDALDGRASFGTFVSAGKSNYVSLFVAYLLAVVVSFVFFVVVGFALLFGIVGVSLTGNGEPGGIAIIVTLLVFLLFIGVVFLLMLFFQFFVQAIVIDGTAAIGGFKHSYRCVRAHPASAFGYTVLVGVVAAVVGVLGVGVSIATMSAPGVTSPNLVASPVLVVASLVLTLISGVLSGFLVTFSVAFYRTIRVPVST